MLGSCSKRYVNIRTGALEVMLARAFSLDANDTAIAPKANSNLCGDCNKHKSKI
jgi:hypothetical protein